MNIEEIKKVYRYIEKNGSACNACKFYEKECVDGIEEILKSKKIDANQFRFDASPYNYFNCNRAYKALYDLIVKPRRVIKV